MNAPLPTEQKLGPALTWGHLASLYPGKAYTRPMDAVFDWAAKQTDRFVVHPTEGTIHLKDVR